MEFSKLTRQREIGVRAIYGSQNADLSDPQYDSRKVQKGSTFFAVRGFAQDGHAFIRDAIKRGATTIVVEDDSYIDKDSGLTWLHVPSTRKALAIISEETFGSPSTKLRLIGVTGTNGKTSTTNFIKQFLESKGERTGLIGTLGIWVNNSFVETAHTTPESRDISSILARMVDDGITTCVMEVSSHALALERVTALDFDIGVFTNITQDHLDFHKSFDEYAITKQKFFTSLKPTAIAVTNLNDAYGNFMVEDSDANVHSYGIHDEHTYGQADIITTVKSMTLHGSTFEVAKRYSEERAVFTTRLVGRFNIENVLAASSALYFGVEGFGLSSLADAASSLTPVAGRFEQLALPTGAIAIIDYAHTPDALENVLTAVRTIDVNVRNIITVFGCGGDRDRTKRPLMGEIGARFSDVVIVTSDNPRTEDPLMIINEIVKGVPRDKVSITIQEVDRRKAIEQGLSLAGRGDVVVIAGKGHEIYQIIGKQKIHFDDKEIVLEWIKGRV